MSRGSMVMSRFKTMLREIIFIACAAFVGNVVYTIWSSGQLPYHRLFPFHAPDRPEATIGMALKLKNENFSAHPVTVTLVVSSQCQYCIRSAPFHAKVASIARAAGIPVYVATPTAADAQSYIKRSGLTASLVNWDDLNVSFRGTPTLVLADSQGIIRRMWLGMVNGDSESEILKIIQQPSLLAVPTARLSNGVRNLDTTALHKMQSERTTRIIDVRERTDFAHEHIADATNIPLPELQLRALFELNHSDLQIVDCSHTPQDDCTLALDELVSNGFEAAALNAGTFLRDVCRSTLVPGPSSCKLLSVN